MPRRWTRRAGRGCGCEPGRRSAARGAAGARAVPGRKAERDACASASRSAVSTRRWAQPARRRSPARPGWRGRPAFRSPQGPAPGLGAAQPVAQAVELLPRGGDLIVQLGHACRDGFLLRLGRGCHLVQAAHPTGSDQESRTEPVRS